MLVLYQRLLCRYAGSVTTLVESMFVLQVSITKHTVVSVIFHASFYHHTNPLFQSYSMQVFITTQSVVSVIFHACVIITYTVVSVIFHACVRHYTYRCFSHTLCDCSSPHIPLFRSYSMQLFITTHTLVSVILHASVLPAKMAGRQTAVQHDQRDAVHAQ